MPNAVKPGPINGRVVLIDAYRGGFVPFHLPTTEFYELVKSRLAPNGVVAQNVEPTTMIFDAALATIGSVFENTDLYDAGGNVVMIAYDDPRHGQAELLETTRNLDGTFRFKYPLSDILARRRPVENMPAMIERHMFVFIPTVGTSTITIIFGVILIACGIASFVASVLAPAR